MLQIYKQQQSSLIVDHSKELRYFEGAHAPLHTSICTPPALVNASAVAATPAARSASSLGAQHMSHGLL